MQKTIKIISIIIITYLILNVSNTLFADEANKNFLYGDANMNSRLTASDSAYILKRVLDNDFKTPSENNSDIGIKAIDVNADGNITVLDAALVLQKVLNISFNFPIENSFSTETSAEATTEISTETPTETTSETNNINIVVQAGGKDFDAVLYDNAATKTFAEKLPLTINMEELNSNEKFKYLDFTIPVSAENPKRINTGDIMLYGSSCVVIFYETFDTSYSYTRLGYIENPEELASALGKDDVIVTFKSK